MSKIYLIFVLLAFVVGTLFSIGMFNKQIQSWNGEDRSLKIKFSHELHVKDQGIVCSDCHIEATKSRLSSDKLYGDHASCQMCHEEQITNNCTFCHQRENDYIAFENPDREIIFSHENHLKVEDVNCSNCHKGLEDVTYATNKNMPTMVDCNTCHDNIKATNQCETCHTDFATLLPKDHRSIDFSKEHKTLTRVGSMDISCTTCHNATFCQQCHDGASLLKFGSDGLISDPMPRLTRRDSPKMLTLQMVHDMNYRFTHGIDANAKKSDCYSCHEKQSFCSACHLEGGNITQGKFKPKWHSEIGFKTFGVGSGGGKHAELARRDIENCATCHDAYGADATCIKCHFDNDGIRGTNPKTHQTGYMKDERGLWHDTNGAVCYTCHTDPNARVNGNKKIGFCSYCHI